MRDLSNTTGPVSYGETSWETGDTPEATTGKTYHQELIYQANTVPLILLFKHYNIRVDAARCIIVCPFKSHKGGRESTGSFKYFSETNSFYCYGCKVGGSWAHGCEFIANIDGISRSKAAVKIINLFGDAINADVIDDVLETENFAEKFKIMLEFSNIVREFRQMAVDEKQINFIENICSVYDTINFKHKLNNKALRRIVNELKEKINSFKL